MRLWLLGLVILSGVLPISGLKAQQTDGTVEGKMVDSDLESKDGPKSHTGNDSIEGGASTTRGSDTKEREGSYEFNVGVHSLAPKTLTDVSIKVYVIARSYNMNSSKSGESVAKILEKGSLTLEPGQMYEFKLGTCDFKRSQTRTIEVNSVRDNGVLLTSKSVKKTRDGYKYLGGVMEIYVGGKLDKVVENTSAAGVDAYRANNPVRPMP